MCRARKANFVTSTLGLFSSFTLLVCVGSRKGVQKTVPHHSYAARPTPARGCCHTTMGQTTRSDTGHHHACTPLLHSPEEQLIKMKGRGAGQEKSGGKTEQRGRERTKTSVCAHEEEETLEGGQTEKGVKQKAEQGNEEGTNR